MALSHYPFVPTPDNPDFATWNNKSNRPKDSYFPDMIHYMDKKVGELLDSLKAKGLSNNTIVIFTGDNGTDGRIVSKFQGSQVRGGKSKTYETGTHVPLIVWAPGNISSGQVNNSLVDFTDFLPTLADMAHIAKPKTYGILDGISFYPFLKGDSGAIQREWVFCHYKKNQGGEGRRPIPIQRWVQDKNYKLYDSTGKFYSIKEDMYEKTPLSDDALSADQKAVKEKFTTILSKMHN
jgi:arylsulfatase A